MSLTTVVLLDALVWGGWSAVVGYGAHRLRLERVSHDGHLTRLRPWERQGRVYEHLAIRRWKDRLPDAGAIFPGGRSKRSLPGRDDVSLHRFAAETRRAELVHWMIPAVTPIFVLWNPAPLVAAMAAYAVLANIPCLLIQRYNRGRVLRVLERRALGCPTAPRSPAQPHATGGGHLA